MFKHKNIICVYINLTLIANQKQKYNIFVFKQSILKLFNLSAFLQVM